MAYDNYQDLVDSIAGYIKDETLTSVINDWVLLFESVAGADLLKHPLNEIRVNYAITGDVWQSLPTGVFSVKSIELQTQTGNRWVRNQSNENIVRTYGQFQPGQPEYFATKNDEIRFGPVPGGQYDTELIYWKKLDHLNTADSNWLYANFPMIYVYGTLLQGEPWLENDPRIQTWQLAYNGAKNVMRRDAQSREFGGTLRSQVRMTKV